MKNNPSDWSVEMYLDDTTEMFNIKNSNGKVSFTGLTKAQMHQMIKFKAVPFLRTIGPVTKSINIGENEQVLYIRGDLSTGTTANFSYNIYTSVNGEVWMPQGGTNNLATTTAGIDVQYHIPKGFKQLRIVVNSLDANVSLIFGI